MALITESQLSARLAHCGPFRRWSPFSAESRHSASTAGTALRAPHLPFAIPIGTGSAPRKDGARRPGAWPRTNEDQAARAGRCSGKAESCRRVGDDAPAGLERRQKILGPYQQARRQVHPHPAHRRLLPYCRARNRPPVTRVGPLSIGAQTDQGCRGRTGQQDRPNRHVIIWADGYCLPLSVSAAMPMSPARLQTSGLLNSGQATAVRD